MRKTAPLSAFFLLILFANNAFAGRPTIKFGAITAADFEQKIYSVDSNANAVILASFGSARYESDDKGGLAVVYKKHLRIRLLNKNGFDAATISIPLFQGSAEEKLDKIEALTYNLVNGKIESTKLDNASIFKDKLNKYYQVKKFTMPNIQEGSIIEIAYTVKSPYETQLEPWYFQGNYPVLWSEYEVAVPNIYDFVILKQGYHPFTIQNTKETFGVFNILDPGTSTQRGEVYTLRTTLAISTWAMENVPAIKREDFTTTLENHISKVSFQLSKLRYPNAPVKNVMTNWYDVADELMKDADFGLELAGPLGWLADDVKKITNGEVGTKESAKKIFEYVRDNFTCTSHDNKYKSTTLRKTFNNKNGNVADINLLLTAMMLTNKIDAQPVLLSTRSNGETYDAYPILSKLNYVISRITIDTTQYLLDASHNKLGFGMLPDECYNGNARVIASQPVLIDLNANTLQEAKLSSFLLFNDGKGGLKGSYSTTLGKSESYSKRESLTKTNLADFFKEAKKGYSFDVAISNGVVDSLKNYDEPIAIKYDLEFKPEEDLVYLTPLLSEATKTNPFKSTKRLYPVEMPYTINELIVVRLDIPEGYKVEEIPKSSRVKFNEDEGMFEYLISKDDKMVQLKSVIKLNKTHFLPEDYDSLRDFFGYIVKKHAEPIVLKKVK